jgi:hypothetical protein
MSKAISSKEIVSQTINQLLEISKLDTLYRDLYYQRAHSLLEPLLTPASYTHLKDSIASLDLTERQLRSAVERGDWKRSAELTERIRSTRNSAAAGAESLRLAEAVYDGLADIPIDPFSSGFHVFVGNADVLTQRKKNAVQLLTSLERSDSTEKDFYARRGADFQTLSIRAESQPTAEAKKVSGPAELQKEALSALESGNLSLLDQLVQKLMTAKPAADETKQESAEVKTGEAARLGEDLLFSFSETTLAGARRLGLSPARTKSRREFAHAIPHGWQPSLMKEETRRWAKDQVSRLTYSSELGKSQKDAIEFFLLNPFITSGGTRYHVCLVVEDLLVEDFAEPDSKQELERTPLLSLLGFESRRGLSRIDIETATLENGPGILKKELALNPEEFRLVAIPPDIYSSLAAEKGWGQQEIWTHFDGYQLRERGKLQALAGGDKRFGGVHDVVSFSPSYTNERIIARFAVVQRKRMMSWHHSNPGYFQ